jgi:hypothetical protein
MSRHKIEPSIKGSEYYCFVNLLETTTLRTSEPHGLSSILQKRGGADADHMECKTETRVVKKKILGLLLIIHFEPCVNYCHYTSRH